MRITEEILLDLEPELKTDLMAHGLLLDKIEVDEIEEDENLVALFQAKLRLKLEVTVIYYRRKK